MVYAVKVLYEGGYYEDCTIVIGYTERRGQRWIDFYIINYLGPFINPEEAEKARLWAEKNYSDSKGVKKIWVESFESEEAFNRWTKSSNWREILEYPKSRGDL